MKRVYQLDYLKGISIMFVIITHVTIYSTLSNTSIVFPYFVNMAVPFFIIVSGYAHSQSYEKRELKTLREYYKFKDLFNKAKAIYVPFVVIYVLELILTRIMDGRMVGIKEAVHIFITGGLGPGSYYIPILMELIVVMPIIYWLVNRNVLQGSLSVIAVQVLLEWMIQITNFPQEIYRLLIVRYLVFLLTGVLLYKYRERQKNILLFLCMCIGAVYIWKVNYEEYVPYLFQFWTTTSAPTALWAGGVTAFFIKYMPMFPKRIDMCMSKIGRSTYYIYLIQMVYFQFGFGQYFTNPLIHSIMSIIICIMVGLLFEKAVSKGTIYLMTKINSYRR